MNDDPAAPPRGFTIAHLTDAHLPTHDRFAWREVMNKRALSALNWRFNRRRMHVQATADALAADMRAFGPDRIAMTGDVTNFGLPREYAAGAAWLGALGRPVSFVPGNHDAMVAGNEAAMKAAFAAFSEGGVYPYVAHHGPAAFIGVSTAVPTPVRSARGLVGAASIDALARLLEASEGRFRVVLIHHPPTELSSPRKHLIDRRAVVGAIAEAGCELVLHGHNHRNELSWIDRPNGARIPVLGAPAASTPAGSRRQAAEWRLIRLPSPASGADGDAIEVLRRRITPSGAFEDAGRFSLAMARPIAMPV